MRIAVVGGGLAGLTVALGCERAGHEVDLYEASDRLGGRMATRAEGDHLIDLGFHVLHTAYPALHRWVDVEALDAKPMDACTMTIHPGTGRRRVWGMRSAPSIPSPDPEFSGHHRWSTLPSMAAFHVRKGPRTLDGPTVTDHR